MDLVFQAVLREGHVSDGTRFKINMVLGFADGSMCSARYLRQDINVVLMARAAEVASEATTCAVSAADLRAAFAALQPGTVGAAGIVGDDGEAVGGLNVVARACTRPCLHCCCCSYTR